MVVIIVCIAFESSVMNLTLTKKHHFTLMVIGCTTETVLHFKMPLKLVGSQFECFNGQKVF